MVIGAVATPFLTLHVTSRSLVIGFVAGLVREPAGDLFSARRLKQVSVRRLLAGAIEDDPSLLNKHRGRQRIWFLLFASIAVLLIPVAASLQGEAAAGLIGRGRCVCRRGDLLHPYEFESRIVCGPDCAFARRFVRAEYRPQSDAELVTIALMAAATFLILAVSAFRLTPTRKAWADLTSHRRLPNRSCMISIPRAAAKELLGPEADQLAAAKVYSFRVKPATMPVVATYISRPLRACWA